ncbi:MAG: hypothetical protein JW786_10820 [Desulfobacterales bacterium]|nr:hypothetical protein [Desulfobacterales bacterium]
MDKISQNRKNFFIYFFILLIMTVFAIGVRRTELLSSWQESGMADFFLGFVLLTAYISAQMLKMFQLPLLSGYIFAGILAGPYVSSFLTADMVDRLRLVDDLALSFIALTAGGALHLSFLKKKIKAIMLNIGLQTLIVFSLVLMFMLFWGKQFNLIQSLSSVQMISLAILLGVTAIARSPSSTIAIISECRAEGPFTETVLGVTITIDVLIIVLYTLALAVIQIIFSGGSMLHQQALTALLVELTISLLFGAAIGKGISFYIERAGHDLPLFLLFIAFGISKTSLWLGHFMQEHFIYHLHLEPLLICMSAGFTIQNFSRSGSLFMESLERVSLPIYVLFFSLAGAALNLDALLICWPLALFVVGVRALGIFSASWIAGTINRDDPRQNRHAWMAYLTQAGVTIGLAQITERQFPEIGVYLTTVVLAVISVNQIIGPITFKAALNRLGEARNV